MIKVLCYNCGKNLSKWPVGREGHRVLGDDCTMRLVLGVENPFTKEREEKRKELRRRKKKKEIKTIRRIQ